MRAAYAHEGLLHGSSTTLWSAWTLDPLVLVPLVLAAYLYGKGSLRVGAREACFWGGMAALFVALVWPLDVMGEQLFFAHMAQHLFLMNLAAPLLVLGAPLAAMLRALPLGPRRALARLGAARRWRAGWHALSGVAVATVVQQVALWAWHTPRGVALALESDGAHIAMHASLLMAALLFWTAVLRPRSGRYWAPIAGLLVTLKVTGVICILLLVQPAGYYSAYGGLAAAWGLTPAGDEHLGWGLMMIVGTLTYLGAALALVGTSFSILERSHPSRGRDRAVPGQVAPR
jgi:putative membrane protein